MYIQYSSDSNLHIATYAPIMKTVHQLLNGAPYGKQSELYE